jgi:hypothetical protein
VHVLTQYGLASEPGAVIQGLVLREAKPYAPEVYLLIPFRHHSEHSCRRAGAQKTILIRAQIIHFPIHLYQSKIGPAISTLFYSKTLLVTHLTSGRIVDSVAVGVENTEAGRLVVVLVGVPEHVHLVESLASDRVPESLSVLDGSDLVRESDIIHHCLHIMKHLRQRRSWGQKQASRSR